MAKRKVDVPGRWDRLRRAGWLLAWGLGFVSAALAAREVRRFVIAEPRFALAPDGLLIQGARHASRARLKAVFQNDFGQSIYLAPLAERRRRLLAVDWVEEATVARLWPNRLVVRVFERRPVAFVRPSRRLLLIDPQGVLLEPPPKTPFSYPVLSGVTEEQSEADRRVRVTAMLRLLEELGAHAGEISEVDAGNVDNLKAVAAVQGGAVELVLGGGNYAARYQSFLNHYPEIRKRAPYVRSLDLRLQDRITVRE